MTIQWGPNLLYCFWHLIILLLTDCLSLQAQTAHDMQKLFHFFHSSDTNNMSTPNT